MNSLVPARPRTRYVARELAFGREHLRRLTRERGALLGWEATTRRLLAADLAEVETVLQRAREAYPGVTLSRLS